MIFSHPPKGEVSPKADRAHREHRDNKVIYIVIPA